MLFDTCPTEGFWYNNIGKTLMPLNNVAMNKGKDEASPLRRHREKLGKTQLDIASELGSHTSRVADYELGRKWIEGSSVDDVAKAFECTPAEFLALLYETRKWSEQRKQDEN
jgi:hypothetical protein